MSAGESFLARWSRRKRTVAVQPDTGETPPPNPAESAKPVSPTTGETPSAPSLPPIESIECAADIKAFLAPGVPLELTRAALRRAWAADPAIRDFIGLSENAWDFNALDGVPGFGSLDLEEIYRLVGQVLGEPQVTGTSHARLADHLAIPAEAAAVVPIAEAPQSIAAAQHEDDERKACQSRPRRHHGGALPK
jgi:Protein of unknown function (DUF3306)